MDSELWAIYQVELSWSQFYFSLFFSQLIRQAWYFLQVLFLVQQLTIITVIYWLTDKYFAEHGVNCFSGKSSSTYKYTFFSKVTFQYVLLNNTLLLSPSLSVSLSDRSSILSLFFVGHVTKIWDKVLSFLTESSFIGTLVFETQETKNLMVF